MCNVYVTFGNINRIWGNNNVRITIYISSYRGITWQNTFNTSVHFHYKRVINIFLFVYWVIYIWHTNIPDIVFCIIVYLITWIKTFKWIFTKNRSWDGHDLRNSRSFYFLIQRQIILNVTWITMDTDKILLRRYFQK